MTTYGAYDAGLPCKNPSCKSHGRPHPNCRCWGEMAEGGEAKLYCSEDRAHQPGCEYFADGGEVPQDQVVPDAAPTTDEIPQDQVVPDKAPQAAPGAPEEVPQDQVVPDQPGGDTGYEGVKPFSKEAFAKEGTDLVRNAGWAMSLVPGAGYASNAILGALGNGLISGGNEAEKLLLGQGSPEDGVGAALAHTGIDTVLGGLFGVAGHAASKGVAKGLGRLAESGLGEKLEYALHGLATSLGGGSAEGIQSLPKNALAGFKAGQNIYARLAAAPVVGAAAEGFQGMKEGGLEGGLKGAGSGVVDGLKADLALWGLSKGASAIGAPTILRALANGAVHNLGAAFDHAANVVSGSHLIDTAVGNLLRTSPAATEHIVKKYGSKEDRDDLDETMSKGGGILQSIKDTLSGQSSAQEPQGFAHGGHVEAHQDHDSMSAVFPEHAMLMGVAKGRISNHLNSLRPQHENAPRLAFDDEPDHRDQKRRYHQALDLANTPLGILEEIRNGTVEPDHVQDFNAMHPELSGLLQKRLTQKITEMQLAGEKPPYKVRQGLSMLMGTSLSSELTPVSIQTAQSVFAKGGQQPSPNQPQKKTGSPSKLSKSDQAFLTNNQALEKRAQRTD